MAKKLTKFLIVLDNESLLYFPGSFLSGKVLLEIDDETPAVALYFHIIGEGVVMVAEKGRLGYNDRENYIDFKMRLLGDGPSSPSEIGSTIDGSVYGGGNRIMILQPGIHTFPFKLGLPLGLPSTFLGKHGWVQYFCRVSLKDPNGVVHKNQQVFIIMNPIDLTLEPPVLTQPFECEMAEKAGCMSSGMIYANVQLDRGAYVPGESIKINAFIENLSGTTVKSTRARLIETILYTAKGKVIKSEWRELAALERGKIPPKCQDIWKGELLYIPPIPPTNLRGCHLIKIHYDIIFTIHKKGPGKAIKLQLPIVMATYPLRNSDGTLKRKKGTFFPTSLPIVRDNFSTDTLKSNKSRN